MVDWTSPGPGPWQRDEAHTPMAVTAVVAELAPDGPLSDQQIGAELARRAEVAEETFRTGRWRSDLDDRDTSWKPEAAATTSHRPASPSCATVALRRATTSDARGSG